MLTATLSPTLLTAVNGTVPAPDAPTPEVQAQLWHITPEVALELLKNARPNRALSKTRVRTLIADIRAGRWQTNGESIILDAELRMIDGQHRCAAIAEAGIAVDALVVVGVSPDVAMSIDQGYRKNGGDMLHMAELPHAQQLSSTAKWLWRFENQRMRQTSVLLRNDELPSFVAQHGGLPASLEWGRSIKSLIPQGAAAMLHFLMAKKDAALSKQVFRSLATGLELSSSDLIWVAREKFLKERSARTHAAVINRCAVLVLAWNRLRQPGQGAGSLTWKGATDASVPFPAVF